MKTLVLFTIITLSIYQFGFSANNAQTAVTSADTAKNITAPAKAKSQLIWVRESDIPPSALKNLQRDSKIQRIEKNIEQIGQYVSIGKEIGSAVDTSLGALAGHIDKISQTNVGKFTMAMVAWKILGDDVLSYFVGILSLFMFVSIWVWSWKNNFYRRRFPKKIKVIQPTWYRPWKKKKVLESAAYEYDHSDFGASWLQDGLKRGGASYLGHILALILGLLIIFLAAF